MRRAHCEHEGSSSNEAEIKESYELSYRADPVRKALIRCDQEDWMRGREQELPEESHRHPSAWWDERYKWINEEGEPLKPDYSTCGQQVRGLEYMRDEFPEQAPNATT